MMSTAIVIAEIKTMRMLIPYEMVNETRTRSRQNAWLAGKV